MNVSARLFSAIVSALVLAGALLAAPAAAENAAPHPRSVFFVPAPEVIGEHACMCRSHGVTYEIGERTCLGERIAECTVEINVMNWRFTNEPCPKV